jgi:hypothetical protein
VVDDGSKDKTTEDVAGIRDPRIKLLRQENRVWQRGEAGIGNVRARIASGI